MVTERQIENVQKLIRYHYENIHKMVSDIVDDEESKNKLLDACNFLDYDRYNIINHLRDEQYKIGR